MNTITVGYWGTRDGRKARVLCTDAPGTHPVKGYIEIHAGSCSAGWTANGAWCLDQESDADLICQWVDRPVVDWSNERDWVKAIAQDMCGYWYRFNGIPTVQGNVWTGIENFTQKMHPTEYPRFSGDWKNSLCLTPKGGSK